MLFDTALIISWRKILLLRHLFKVKKKKHSSWIELGVFATDQEQRSFAPKGIWWQLFGPAVLMAPAHTPSSREKGSTRKARGCQKAPWPGSPGLWAWLQPPSQFIFLPGTSERSQHCTSSQTPSEAPFPKPLPKHQQPDRLEIGRAHV